MSVVPIRPILIAAIMGGGLAAGRTFDPAVRGFVIRYQGAETRCPGCGRSNWLVGRQTAECAFCAVALPLEHPGVRHRPA